MRARFLRLLWGSRERPRRDELDARLGQSPRRRSILVMAAKDAKPQLRAYEISEAIKALQAALAEHNALVSSTAAIGHKEAVRLLADIISGQMGKPPKER